MFELVDRPPRNRRTLWEDMPWDSDVEAALWKTVSTGKAVVMPLWMFHCSPAKGRLWKKGWKVHHRVLSDKQTVAAWMVAEETKDEDKY